MYINQTMRDAAADFAKNGDFLYFAQLMQRHYEGALGKYEKERKTEYRNELIAYGDFLLEVVDQNQDLVTHKEKSDVAKFVKLARLYKKIDIF